MMSLDLVLVNPSSKKQMYGSLSDSLIGIEPPIWTALIAAFVRRKGFSVAIIDAVAEGLGPTEVFNRIREYNPRVIGLAAIGANPSAASTPKMLAVRSLLNLIQENNFDSKTVLYGIHPSALAEETLREEKIDFVIKGEAFYPILNILKETKSQDIDDLSFNKGICYLRDKKFISGGWAKVVENLDELPFAAWDLLPMDKYRAHNWHCFGHIRQRSPYAIIYTSFGCPFDCKYCNIHSLYGGSPGIRYRSPEKVVEEIDFLVKNYNIKHLKILDELFVSEKSRVDRFCDLLIKRNYRINIWAYARVDTVNELLLKKLKQAGVNWICYGFEAASKKVRDGVSKGRFDQEAIYEAARITHDAGIHIIGNFMFGLPDDDQQSMQETLNLAKKLRCEYVNFYTTMAYPGSKLYQEAIKQKKQLPKSWSGYSQFSYETLPLPTKYLSSAEVLSFRDRAFVDYYSDPEYSAMIKEVFGEDTVEHIKDMLKYKLKRKLLETEGVKT